MARTVPSAGKGGELQDRRAVCAEQRVIVSITYALKAKPFVEGDLALDVEDLELDGA